MKLHVHDPTMVIYIQYKFHKIPSISHLHVVIAEDGKTDRQTDGRMKYQMDEQTKPISLCLWRRIKSITQNEEQSYMHATHCFYLTDIPIKLHEDIINIE